MLKCPCGLAYIGKTSRPLKNIISEHRCVIGNRDQKSLSYIGIEHVQLAKREAGINT